MIRPHALLLTILLTGCESFIGTVNVNMPDPFKSDPATDVLGTPGDDGSASTSPTDCPKWMDLPPDAREYLGTAASRPPGMNEWLAYLRDTVRPFLDNDCTK